MPRFPVTFTKRKSASDLLDNAPLTSPDTPSFRVIERTEIANGRSFDGGVRMARGSKSFAPKTNLLDFAAEDNMFADLKVNRGSNISNTTKGTSTENSSRHSNASTAPSSADMSGPVGQDDIRPPPKTAPQEPSSRASSKSIGSGLLDRATRTFSFGGQKKQSIPPPVTHDPVPDLPPLPSLGGQKPGPVVFREMTTSKASTAPPANPEGNTLDLGGDFGSMFKGFDKRASTATLTLAAQDNTAPRSLTGNHCASPGLTSHDGIRPTEPLLSRRQISPPYGDSSISRITSPYNDAPPPVPRHEHLNSFKYSSRPADIMEDEDAKFLRESRCTLKFVSEPHDPISQTSRPRYGDDRAALSTTIASSFQKEENMFEGSTSRTNRTPNRHVPRSSNPTGNKVMTPAQFEKYRQDKENPGASQQVHSNDEPLAKEEDDDEDEINYDDDDDEQEKSKQQAKQRRKQEAHMAVYRQQMMKVTGETNSAPLPTRQAARPTPSPASTTPTLGHLKPPSPDPAANHSSEEDDEDIPLAILQAHGFPHKNRPPTRLASSGSNPNLRASVIGTSPGRPSSAMGAADPTSNKAGRQHNLPAFARNLPQDPFVGASIARPAIRESLTFGDARQPSPQPQGSLPPGGLVGVIASEERSRAMRRGSPNVDSNKLIGAAVNANGNLGHDPYAAPPSHMMYNAGGLSGMPQMHQMPQPMLSVGDQAQIQMTQQMTQFMQMQMQFMQMMATSQNGASQMPQQSPMQVPPYGGMLGNQSVRDFNRHSMVMDPTIEPRQTDRHMRTMSMVQPSSASFMAQFQKDSPSIHGVGGTYSASIAPSERSNVGLPGRYRPVSQAPALLSALPGQHIRSNTLSGDMSNWSDDKSKSTVKLMSSSKDVSDDDDEQGWEAMKAKREKKRSFWRNKKNTIGDFDMTF